MRLFSVKPTLCMMTLLLGLWCSGGSAEDSPPAEHSIILERGADAAIFGGTVSLHVIYRNDGRTAWVVPTPSESISVHLKYRPALSERRPWGHTLGRSLTTILTGKNGKRVYAYLDPTPKPLTIPAEATYQFQVPFQRQWNGNLTPGLWSVWIQDSKNQLESNRVEIPFRFTTESVAACLKISMDKEAPIYKRDWHSRWLQRFDADLKLTWLKYGSTEVKPEIEIEIQKELKEFAEYWEAVKETRRVARIIAAINREAGLKPEAEVESESEAEPAGKASE